MHRSRPLIVAALLAAFGFGGCQTAIPEEPRVAAALEHYRELIMAIDAPGIAAMYTSDGELSHADGKPYIGPENIRAFLQQFSNFKILAYDLTAAATKVEGNTATQTGTYRQTVVTPDGKTVRVHGTFEIRWSRQPDGRWLVRRLHTES